MIDTPRTEAARFEALRSSALRQDCVPLKLGQELERESEARRTSLAFALNEIKKLEAEVERLTEALKSCWHAANTYDGNYTRACDNVELIVRNALK
jgi:hypothetical protein